MELRRLADVQSLRQDTRDNGKDLRQIGDELADLVPLLKQADRQAESGDMRNSAGASQGTVVQGRDITGDVGTVIKGTHGQVHAGKGDNNLTTQHFSGDGATNVQGDNHGGVSHRFGLSRSNEDDR